LDPRDRRGSIDLVGKDLTPTRDDKHVVEGERFGPGKHLIVHHFKIGEIAPDARTQLILAAFAALYVRRLLRRRWRLHKHHEIASRVRYRRDVPTR
jgi:hypothetical protein